MAHKAFRYVALAQGVFLASVAPAQRWDMVYEGVFGQSFAASWGISANHTGEAGLFYTVGRLSTATSLLRGFRHESNNGTVFWLPSGSGIHTWSNAVDSDGTSIGWASRNGDTGTRGVATIFNGPSGANSVISLNTLGYPTSHGTKIRKPYAVGVLGDGGYGALGGNQAGFVAKEVAGTWTVKKIIGLGGTAVDMMDVNSAGVAVGGSGTPATGSFWRAFVVKPGIAGDYQGTIAELNNGNRHSVARSINESGQIVGWVKDDAGYRKASYWSSDTASFTWLPTLPGFNSSEANRINNRGEVTGICYFLDGNGNSTSQVAFFWSASRGLLPVVITDGGGTFANGIDMSTFGVICGFSGAGAAYCVPRRTYQGTAFLADFVGAVPGMPVTVEMVSTVTGATLTTSTGVLGAGGAFNIPITAVPPSGSTFGSVNKVRIRVGHWLSKVVNNVAFDSLGAVNINAQLKNGDCNSDNVVDLTDYTIVAVAFNAVPSSGNWDAQADLNGDEVVDLTDYTIVVSNFNAVGE